MKDGITSLGVALSALDARVAEVGELRNGGAGRWNVRVTKAVMLDPTADIAAVRQVPDLRRPVHYRYSRQCHPAVTYSQPSAVQM